MMNMEPNMTVEAGAGLAAKYGLIGKLTAMFVASALGAAIIAWYHPTTRAETLWRAMGAGFGGMFVGGMVLRFASNHFDFLAPPSDMRLFWDWMIEVVLPILFLFGGLFWGLVGMLQQLAGRIERGGAKAVANRIGIEDETK